MTTSSASAKPVTKSTTTTEKPSEVKKTPVVENTSVVENNSTPEVKKSRIPEPLATQFIFNDLCKRYLDTVDKIAEYNKAVLAEKTSDWNTSKVIVKARDYADSAVMNGKPNLEIKKALDDWELAKAEADKKRKVILDLTAKELGITLSNTTERNPETEAPLKDERKIAHTIGTQLSTMGELSNEKAFTEAIETFLNENKLPLVGRDQVSTFGDTSKSTTPKYRVHIMVTNAEGEQLISEDGFTKTALAVSKYYPKGESLSAASLRSAWEKAGNTVENTVQPDVEFMDNDLVFKISKR